MFFVKIAGIVVQINNRYAQVRNLCREYEVFGEEPRFAVSASDAEILAEQAGQQAFSLPYCEGLCVYRKLCRGMVDYDAFLLHAAVVELDGAAYAFAAASGTGKTTHIRLWQQVFGDRVSVINGDKPILRFLDNTLYACGTPWQGKEGMGKNEMCPLKAVCFLERGRENRIRRMEPAEAVGRLFHQLLLPDEEAQFGPYMDLLDRMLTMTDFYLLECNMEPEAAMTACRGMKG